MKPQHRSRQLKLRRGWRLQGHALATRPYRSFRHVRVKHMWAITSEELVDPGPWRHRLKW